jgi:CRISPR-associated protein Cmr1
MTTRPLLLDLTYEIVTPLFMSGVDQTRPELRVPSIRGAARAWYRAIDPRFRAHEAYTFGAADHKWSPDDEGFSQQSPFLLRIVKVPDEAAFTLDRNAYRRFDRGQPPTKTNGILYTGFSLLDRFNTRQALPASTRQRVNGFTLRLVFLQPSRVKQADGTVDPLLYYRVLGSFWALGHLGGLGSRCNRGWGSVQLISLKAVGSQVLPEVNEVVRALQPASTQSVKSWLADVDRTLTTLRRKLGGARDGHALATPHLGPGAQISVATRPSREWDEALEPMGASLQSFRREVSLDRREVMRHLFEYHRASPRAKAAAVALRAAPRRVSFGLPLTFRFGIVPKAAKELGLERMQPETIEFAPDGMQRHASLLRLRVVRLGDGCHAVAVRLQGDPPGSKLRDDGRPSETPAVAITGAVSAGNRPTGDEVKSLPANPSDEGGVDDFMRSLLPHTSSLTVPR